MLTKIIPNSLPIRAWTAVISITLLCFLSAFSSGILAWVSEADAQAINTAGSIRMATYRINYQLESNFKHNYFYDVAPSLPSANTLDHRTLASKDNYISDTQSAIKQSIEDMEARIVWLKDYQNAFNNSDSNIDTRLTNIHSLWETQLKPSLLEENKSAFFNASRSYITDVDGLVSQLQYRNERRQKLQQLIQMISLLLSVLIMSAGLWELKHKVLTPIHKFKKANQRFRNGNFDTRMSMDGYIEFKALGDSFNDMAKTIESYQSSLEKEVKTKTAHLTQANKVLFLLYDFSKSLTTPPLSIVELNRLVAEFGEIIPELNFTLCIKNDLVNDQDSIAIHSNQLKELCSTQTCDTCMINISTHTKSYPIQHHNVQYGDLKVRPKYLEVHQPLSDPLDKSDRSSKQYLVPSSTIRTERINLLNEERAHTKHMDTLIEQNDEAITALTNLISISLFLVQQRKHEHQNILLEERATIARELHDSLAQSLSYLKIQVSILEKRLNHTHCTSVDFVNITESIAKIKDGLTSAYQHLRDLLVTFRLSLNDDSFDEALYNSAKEFAKRGGFEITVYNQVMSLNLNATEQVNIIQIVREALSNICRHANAENVEVTLKYVANSNQIILTIIDDGVGVSHDFDQTHHHGMMIMQERANSLGGSFSIRNNLPKGTMVQAKFAPEFLSSHETELV